MREWAGPLRFLLTIGWYMVVSLLVPTLLGYFWLDPKFNKAPFPLFTLIGLGIGTGIAFYGLARMLRRYKTEQNELNKDKR
ncbi:MAG: AtpZ/AtpI family protein [Dehalococcoidia bacterium]|nr:AtpZ/AtpI family protein [Dehalococcoidia bacterium]